MPRAASPFLEEALTIASSLRDGALECDVLCNLGFACQSTGQAKRSVDLLQQALDIARRSDDNYVAKIILERLGHAYFQLGDAARCHAALQESLAFARNCGDRRHEATILWLLAILHADRKQRDQALMNGQAAVQVMETSGNPQAPWYAEQLHHYRAGEIDGQQFVPALTQGQKGNGGQPIRGLAYCGWQSRPRRPWLSSWARV